MKEFKEAEASKILTTYHLAIDDAIQKYFKNHKDIYETQEKVKEDIHNGKLVIVSKIDKEDNLLEDPEFIILSKKVYEVIEEDTYQIFTSKYDDLSLEHLQQDQSNIIKEETPWYNKFLNNKHYKNRHKRK